jgi:hypothetical protein
MMKSPLAAEQQNVSQRNSESNFMKACLIGVLSVLSVGCRETITSPDALFELLQPPCVNPAPVLGQFNARAPGFVVVFQGGVEASGEARRLAGLYRFTPQNVFTHALQGFSAQLIRSARPLRTASVTASVSVSTMRRHA